MNFQSNPKRTIVVKPYQKEWVKIFQQESDKISELLAENLVKIHHIGSTSVPSLAAKPIIDIIPVVKNIASVDSLQTQWQNLGYTVCGEYGIPFRRYYFRKAGINSIGSIDAVEGFNIHLYQQGNPEIDRKSGFCKLPHKKRMMICLTEKQKQFFTGLLTELSDKNKIDLSWPYDKYDVKYVRPEQSHEFHFVLYEGLDLVGIASYSKNLNRLKFIDSYSGEIFKDDHEWFKQHLELWAEESRKRK